MNRPGPVPLVILAVFGVVAVIEFRTILSMLGVDVPPGLYFGIAVVTLLAVFGSIFVLTEPPGDRDTQGKVDSARS